MNRKIANNNPFEMVEHGEVYYNIFPNGQVYEAHNEDYNETEADYALGNYCTDKSMMEQRALHEILSRLLWRFSIQNRSEKRKLSELQRPLSYIIGYITPDILNDKYEFHVYASCNGFGLEPRFDTREIAELAIDAIIKPFMQKYPKFKW